MCMQGVPTFLSYLGRKEERKKRGEREKGGKERKKQYVGDRVC